MIEISGDYNNLMPDLVSTIRENYRVVSACAHRELAPFRLGELRRQPIPQLSQVLKVAARPLRVYLQRRHGHQSLDPKMRQLHDRRNFWKQCLPPGLIRSVPTRFALFATNVELQKDGKDSLAFGSETVQALSELQTIKGM